MTKVCCHFALLQYIVKQQGNKAVFEQGTDKATPLHYAACKCYNISLASYLVFQGD